MSRKTGLRVGETDIDEMAQAIRLRTGCPVITKPMIAEVVRAASYFTAPWDPVLPGLLADARDPAAWKPMLEAIGAASDDDFKDPVLEGLITVVRDPGGFKMMSIAENNRIDAYMLSMVSLSLLALMLQACSTGFDLDGPRAANGAGSPWWLALAGKVLGVLVLIAIVVGLIGLLIRTIMAWVDHWKGRRGAMAEDRTALSFAWAIYALPMLIGWGVTRGGAGQWRHLIAWSLLAVQVVLAMMVLRAWAYWKERCDALTEEQVTRRPCAPPRVLSPYQDFPAWVISQDSVMAVHVNWAPAWETVCFQVVPFFFLVLTPVWVTDQVLRICSVDPEIIRQVILYEVVALFVVSLWWSIWMFSVMHEYRWWETRRLRQRLGTLRRDWKLYRMGVLTEDPTRELVALGRRLWIITGHEPYRDVVEFLD